MLQHELKPAVGSRKAPKRVGRGNASGHGTYSCRGGKGQTARSGGNVRPGFEGGQTPWYRRLPKLRGFINHFRTEYQVINVVDLNRFVGQTVSNPELYAAGLISDVNAPVKLLANGDLSGQVTVKLAKTSKAAEEKVKAAGGSVELLA